MYRDRMMTELERACEYILWLIDISFDLEEKEIREAKCYMCEKLSDDLFSVWEYEDLKYEDMIRLRDTVRELIYELLKVEFIPYEERSKDFNFRASIIPTEIGNGWIELLRREYGTVIELLHKLIKMYAYLFRKVIRKIETTINESGMLEKKIYGDYKCIEQCYSKLYRMQLLFEKSYRLNKLILLNDMSTENG